MSDFGTSDATALYNVDRWGSGYFTINRNGNVAVRPYGRASEEIDLMELVDEALAQNLAFPMVIRFQDILHDRVRTVNRAFAAAITESGYRNCYRGVFPIKVNQLREVVEEILEAGKDFHFGIEAGSKPELMAALAMHSDLESLIVCNGYKDTEFIRMAMLGRKLGKKVILVVEKLEELLHVLEVSEEVGVEPMIGLRVRLLSKGAGKWATSGGENAKFGLSTADLVAASELLHARKQAGLLKLVHFHVGSQVPDIGTIKRATREAARFFAKLSKMGHALEYIDVGGGLGVDYDGSRTTFDSSTNYSLNEYARDIVYSIMEICDAEGVAHPTIVSEGGRAIVAHHSVLITEAFGSIEKSKAHMPVTAGEEDPKPVHDIIEIRENLGRKNRLENLHDAQEIRERAQSMFDLGLLDLPAKAKVDTVYWDIAGSIVEAFRGMRYVPEEVKEMEIALGDQFLCNFSVFQSLLDHWALGQLFPVMPIHRLNELPDRNATLVDITCDLLIGEKRVNDVPPKDRDIAMVFQNYALYPHMSVFDNMAFGLKLRKYPKPEIQKRVKQAAEILGLETLLERKPTALSGGQRQRVAVGRAIVRQPKVFLFDEPLSNLDARMRVQMRTEITKLHQRLQATMIYVTHDQVEAMTMGTRIVVMDDGEIQQVDTPLKVYNEPANLFVAGFLGSPPMNILKGTLKNTATGLVFKEAGSGVIELHLDNRASAEDWIGREILLGIRPEHCDIVESTGGTLPRNTFQALVDIVEPMGAETHFHISTGANNFIVRSNRLIDPSTAGHRARFVIDASRAHLFNPTTTLRIV